MTEPPVVFLGPSLPLEEARRACATAVYRPPARRGDLPRLLGELPDTQVVGLVDGYFEQVASVGHREIRSLLERGIRVLGGGSMGALRAAELAELGMEPVGKVAEWYLQGWIRSDDEVAVAVDPLSARALTVPMVTVRWAVQSALREGLLGEAVALRLLDRARGLHFSERTWSTIGYDLDEEQFAHVVDERYDLKRRDALAVIERCRSITAGAGRVSRLLPPSGHC